MDSHGIAVTIMKSNRIAVTISMCWMNATVQGGQVILKPQVKLPARAVAAAGKPSSHTRTAKQCCRQHVALAHLDDGHRMLIGSCCMSSVDDRPDTL